MPRKSSPWWKASHGCYYTRINGKLVRLDVDLNTSVLMVEAMTRGTPAHAIPRPHTPAGPTVAQLAGRYLAASERRVKPSTLSSIRLSIGQFVAALGGLAAAEIGVAQVREWLDAGPWGPSTRWLRAAHVTTLFRWAVDEEILPAYRLGRLRKGKVARRPPVDEAEVRAFRAAIRTADMADWFDVALSCGARPGELSSLEARHVNQGLRHAAVSGKTGERTIYFPAAVAGLLGRLMGTHPTGPLLRRRSGKPWTRGTLDARFRYARLTGGGGSLTPYHLRGAFASRCYAAGCDLATVQELLGHRPADITRRHYLTIPRDRLLEAVDRGWAWAGSS